MKRAVIIVALLGCKEPTALLTDAAVVTPVVATTSASTTPIATVPPSPPPVTWWTATPTASNDKSTGWMRFTTNETAFIPKNGLPVVHDMKLAAGTASHWEWSARELTTELRCTLDQDAATSHASFQCTAGAKSQAFALEPLADFAKAKTLDALLDKARPPKDVCEVAEACGNVVFSARGSKFKADVELGNPRSPQMCKKALVGLRAMAGMNGAPPAECK